MSKEERNDKINAFLDDLFEGDPGVSIFRFRATCVSREIDPDKTLAFLKLHQYVKTKSNDYIILFNKYAGKIEIS